MTSGYEIEMTCNKTYYVKGCQYHTSNLERSDNVAELPIKLLLRHSFTVLV
jgi:hypothetical protein